MRLHWESEDRVEWAHIGHGHTLHVQRNEGMWTWSAIGATGACDDPDSAREAAEQAAVKYVTEIAESAGLVVIDSMTDTRPIIAFENALRARILCAIDSHRDEQDAKHGAQQDLPVIRPGERLLDPEAVLKARYERRKRAGTLSHGDIILEELAEAFDAPDYESMREELIQSAACIVKAIEALDWQQKRKGEP